MEVIALSIGGCALLMALMFVVVKIIQSMLPEDFGDGPLADGGNKQKIDLLTAKASALGLDVEEYETWDEIEQAIDGEDNA